MVEIAVLRLICLVRRDSRLLRVRMRTEDLVRHGGMECMLWTDLKAQHQVEIEALMRSVAHEMFCLNMAYR